jgi:dTDP-3-amino-3,4,6-trideoxy-alpha-D-glucose transaminase
VLEAGATPVLVDIEQDRPLLRLDATLDAITPRTRAVILVHLYGIPADAAGFAAELAERGVALIEDCAQAQGASLVSGRTVGTAGVFAALSFYPTKNLGALGDGGAIVTDDDALAGEAAAWRSHGERASRYWHELPARNSRLDDVQAAVLRLRLARLDDCVHARRALSDSYERLLPVEAGYVAHGDRGAPHLAVINVADRDGLAAELAKQGIGTGIHYPHALSEQPALAGRAPHGDAVNARRWAARCLSLPLHPRMSEADVERVGAAVCDVLGAH